MVQLNYSNPFINTTLWFILKNATNWTSIQTAVDLEKSSKNKTSKTYEKISQFISSFVHLI
jgi:hypothetical protein